MSDAWSWLESTEKLQVEYFNNDLRSFEGKELAEAVGDNILWATDELHEALAEVEGVKSWSSEPVKIRKQAFLGEIVDALHFVANLLVLAQATEDELWDAYRAKQQRNRERMSKLGGYQASRNKCPNCKRELDREGAYTLKNQSYTQEGEKHIVFSKLECSGCSTTFDYVYDPLQESLPNQSTSL